MADAPDTPMATPPTDAVFRERAIAFETMHPLVPVTYVVGMLGVALFARQPVCQLISLAGALCLSLVTRGVRPTLAGLRWQLPMLALVCLANPLFSASGSTELLRVGGIVVYGESLAYGAVSGCMLVSTVLWLECASRLVGEERLLSLAGAGLPTVGLMVSMAAQLMPQLLRRGNELSDVRAACTAASPADGVTPRPGGRGARDRGVLVSGILMSWAMEDSLERADSMRARGWGASSRRTTYRDHRFGNADALATFGLCLLSALSWLLAYVACGQWSFFPTMPRLVVWWGYLVLALQALLPTVITLVRDVSWRYVDHG